MKLRPSSLAELPKEVTRLTGWRKCVDPADNYRYWSKDVGPFEMVVGGDAKSGYWEGYFGVNDELYFSGKEFSSKKEAQEVTESFLGQALGDLMYKFLHKRGSFKRGTAKQEQGKAVGAGRKRRSEASRQAARKGR